MKPSMLKTAHDDDLMERHDPPGPLSKRASGQEQPYDHDGLYDRPDARETQRRLLSLREAAIVLGVSYWTVRDYVLSGVLRSVTLPPLRPREGARPNATLRRTLIDVRDLDAFIDGLKA